MLHCIFSTWNMIDTREFFIEVIGRGKNPEKNAKEN